MNREGRYTDLPWRKSRLAARILLRKADGRMTERDKRWAKVLKADPAVTNRLIDQGIYSLLAGDRKDELIQRLGLGKG